MHQFVQSAIEAANQGDKNKAMGFIKEVLSTNPNDVDAWLVLAAIINQPERKRQCLNRVLSLDPANKLAREELLEMDRAAMGGMPPFVTEPFVQTQDKSAPVSTPKYQPVSKPLNVSPSKPITQPAPQQATHVSLPDWAEETPKAKPQAAPAPKPASKSRAEKPLVFKYSTINRILTYIFAVIVGCLGLLALLVLQDPAVFIYPCGLSLLFIPAIWIVSGQVEMSEKGIRASRMFGLISSQVDWDEIARIKSNSMQRNLELITKKGDSVKVTTQVSGYPAIVETLRQKRPDLFSLAQPSSVQSNAFASDYGDSPSMGYSSSTAAPSFSGTRTFKKSFFRQYGLLLLVIPFCLLALWTAYTEPEYRIGAGISAVFCFILTILPFFQVGSVKVEPNKLTVETFVEQKEFSARQIKEIKMQSVRGRRGTVTNFVNIVPVEGKNYPLQGFSDGDEIIYGILHQWWEAYRNR